MQASGGMMYKINFIESETFQIFTTNELYLTWFSFSLSFIGLIIVIIKLVKTWKN